MIWFRQSEQPIITKSAPAATGKTPPEAREPSHEAGVKISMGWRCEGGRVFPTLEVGDTARALRKKTLREKARVGNSRKGELEFNSPSKECCQHFD